MTQHTDDFLKVRVKMVHALLLRAGEETDSAQFAHAFSKEAPPIGWHLWHMARFADRLQSQLSAVTKGDPVPEIWYRDEIAKQWHCDPQTLGVFESGMGQADAVAQSIITQVGKDPIIAYAQMVFEICDATVANLKKKHFDKSYKGVLNFETNFETGEVWETEAKESTVAQDLIFHISHASRHVGMMEALRGLLGAKGTLSV